jgi:hypothetical protein
MHFVKDKLAITKIVVSILKEKQIEFPYEQAAKIWWKNPRKLGGLRLTDAGNQAFISAELESYSVDCSFKHIQTWSRAALTLDKKILCPYYLENPKKPTLVIYDSRVLVLIHMYGGLEDYLNTIGD